MIRLIQLPTISSISTSYPTQIVVYDNINLHSKLLMEERKSLTI